jgi:hypothetical protein
MASKFEIKVYDKNLEIRRYDGVAILLDNFSPKEFTIIRQFLASIRAKKVTVKS